MRRSSIALVLALVVTVLAGCSGGGGGGGGDAGAGASGDGGGGGAGDTAVVQDDAAFPMTIDHLLGSTTFEEPPTRIVALGPADQDIAIALGIVPIAMVENPYDDSQIFPWVASQDADLSDVTFLPWVTELASIEKIAALKPDAVLATTAEADAGLYDRYSKMGVPILPPIEGPVADDWRSLTLAIGKVLGREERAKEVVAEVDATIAAVRDRVPAIEGKTFVMGSANGPGQIRVVNRSTDTVAQFFADLGMVIPPQLEAVENSTIVGATDISTERIELLEADAIFLAGSSRDDLEGWKPFQELTAVRNGAYLAYGSELAYGLRVPTPLSVPYVLEEIEPVLAKVPAD